MLIDRWLSVLLLAFVDNVGNFYICVIIKSLNQVRRPNRKEPYKAAISHDQTPRLTIAMILENVLRHESTILESAPIVDNEESMQD